MHFSKPRVTVKEEEAGAVGHEPFDNSLTKNRGMEGRGIPKRIARPPLRIMLRRLIVVFHHMLITRSASVS